MTTVAATERRSDNGPERDATAASSGAERAEDRVAVVHVAGRRVALPFGCVERAAQLPAAIAPPVPAGTALVGFGTDAGLALPLIDLAMLLGVRPVPLPARAAANEAEASAPPLSGALVVVSQAGRRCGLLVDRVDGLEPLRDDRRAPLRSWSSPAGDTTALVLDKDDAAPLLLLDMATLLASPGVLLAEGEGSSAAAKAALSEDTLCFLTLRIAGCWYAAAIDAVQEIVVAPTLEAHPAGIPGLRRRLVLRSRRYLVLELPDAEAGGASQTGAAAYGVIMRSEPGLYALEAEAIGTVVTIAASEVTAVPSVGGSSVAQAVASSFAGRNGEGEVLVISPEALPSQPGFDAVFAHEARNAIAAETASRQKGDGSEEGEGYAARLPVSLLRLDLGGELFVETASIWQSAVLPSDSLFLTASPPPGALGYLRYRGETAVVADLGALVAGQPAPRDGRHLRVIVIRAPWGLLALIVHEITGIERLWLERAGAPAAEHGGPLGGGRHIHFASARGRDGRRMIGIVDLEAVVAELSGSMTD